MTDSRVRIGLVLPDVMGTYGDGGNAVVLRQRLLLRGIPVEITLADPVPESLDLYTLGGAEDYAQRLATRHLIKHPGLQRAAERGAPVLAICAAVQVLGHWYETSAGERGDGVGMLDVTTTPQDARTIGDRKAHRLRKPPRRNGSRRCSVTPGCGGPGCGQPRRGRHRRRGSGQRGRDVHARSVPGPQPGAGRPTAEQGGG